MLVARHYRIEGRVQGVGFRYFAQRAAIQEGLSGYVRNADDGSVEARAEGDLEAVERFERHLRRGPSGARVERVEVADAAPSGRATGFIVKG
jgi:acylphosphatase